MAKTEFSPKFGVGYKGNAKANKEYYKQSAEKTGITIPKVKKLGEILDFRLNDSEVNLHKDQVEIEYTTQPSKEYIERVRYNTLGFNNKAEYERYLEDKSNYEGEYEGNENYYNMRSTKVKASAEKSSEFRNSGLRGRMYGKKKFKPLIAVEEGVVSYTFDTSFINEEHMLSFVPEQAKINEGVFHMIDNNDNTYIVECSISPKLKYTDLRVVKHINDKSLNENINRIKNLFDYSSKDLYGYKGGKSKDDVYESIGKVKNLIGYDEQYV